MLPAARYENVKFYSFQSNLSFVGTCCNFDPNSCCNYLQTACLPDPIKSGIYTCQKVDTYRPRLAPLSYNLPFGHRTSYGLNYGSAQIYGADTNYGSYGSGLPEALDQNYAAGQNYGIGPVYQDQFSPPNEHQSYPVQRAAQPNCHNADGTPKLNLHQCANQMSGVRRDLNSYEQILRQLLHQGLQSPTPYKVDPLNYGPLMGGYAGRK